MVINGVADGGHRPFPSAVRSYSGAVGPGFLLIFTLKSLMGYYHHPSGHLGNPSL